jgi:hypothetical protein
MAGTNQCARAPSAVPTVPVDLKRTRNFAPVLPDTLRDDGLTDAIVG